MAETEQILKAMKNRVKGMLEEAKQRHRPGLRQQVEELQHLLEMLEKRLG
jgi:ATP-dependent Zn protease